MWMSVLPAWIPVYRVCLVPDEVRGHQMLWGLKLRTVLFHHVGAETQTQVGPVQGQPVLFPLSSPPLAFSHQAMLKKQPRPGDPQPSGTPV